MDLERSFLISNIAVSAMFLWLLGVILYIPGAQGVTAEFVVIISIFVFCLSLKFQNKFFLKEKNVLFIVVVSFISICYFIIAYQGYGEFSLPRSIALFLVPMFLISRNAVSIGMVVTILTLSSLFLMVFSLIEIYSLGSVRLSSYSNPAQLSFNVGILFLISIYFFTFRFSGFYSFLLLLTLLVLTLLVIASQTRAVFFSLIIAISLLAFKKGKSLCNNTLSIALLLIVFGASFAFFGLVDRILFIGEEFYRISEGDFSGSIGVRLELWSAGIRMLDEISFLGVGIEKQRLIIQELFIENKISERTYEILNHPRPSFHNDYIQAFIMTGWVGSIAFIIFLFLPTILLSQIKAHRDLLYALQAFVIVCSFFESYFLIYESVVYAYLGVLSLLVITEVEWSDDKKQNS